MKLEERMEKVKKRRNKKIKEPFCKCFQNALKEIEELPDVTDAFGVGVKYDAEIRGYRDGEAFLSIEPEQELLYYCDKKNTRYFKVKNELFAPESGREIEVKKIYIIFLKNPQVFITLYGNRHFLKRYYGGFLNCFEGFEECMDEDKQNDWKKDGEITFKFDLKFFQ